MTHNTALLLIDFQKAFDHPDYFGTNHNNPQAEENAHLLQDRFRQKGMKHNSVFPKSPLRNGQSGERYLQQIRLCNNLIR